MVGDVAKLAVQEICQINPSLEPLSSISQKIVTESKAGFNYEHTTNTLTFTVREWTGLFRPELLGGKTQGETFSEILKARIERELKTNGIRIEFSSLNNNPVRFKMIYKNGEFAGQKINFIILSDSIKLQKYYK